MTKLKLTGLSTILFAIIILSSCKKNNDNAIVSNINTNMTGAKAVPANASAATGNMQATYNSNTRVLSYKITWSGLSGNPTAIHIHALAGPGYVPPTSPPLPFVINPFPNGIAQNITGFTAATSGSFSGTLYADNLNPGIREADLKAGQYYVDIHTATYPTGEIRGQLIFAP